MKTYTWTTDLAKITIKLPQEYFVQELELKVLNVTPKYGAWDTIWAKYIWVNNKIEYLWLRKHKILFKKVEFKTYIPSS